MFAGTVDLRPRRDKRTFSRPQVAAEDLVGCLWNPQDQPEASLQEGAVPWAGLEPVGGGCGFGGMDLIGSLWLVPFGSQHPGNPWLSALACVFTVAQAL